MPTQKFFDWTSLPFNITELATRRAGIQRQLSADGGVFLTPSSHHFSDGSTFRQLDDFLYFTGLELPDSVLAIDAEHGTTTIFMPERDPRFESAGRASEFPGRSLLGDTEIANRSGINDLRSAAELDRYLASLAKDGRTVWVNPGRGGAMAPIVSGYNNGWTALDGFRYHLQKQHPSLNVLSAYAAVAILRMVKSPAEIALVERAMDIAIESIIETAGHIRPGINERSLEGILESGFKRGGAQRLPFDSIIKSGPNTLWPWRVLASHYDRRNRAVQAGEMVVFDVGCEIDYYGSDIGRTFPVSGMFSAEQTSILDMQLDVLDAIIATMKPGVTLAEAHQAALATIPASASPYMQVGLFFGHHIGMAAGDPSLVDVPFEPGMVITVEPWYYNHDKQIATFIEDDILITPDGNKNMTYRLPRTADGMASLVHANV